jgi:hypothetical protein
MLDFRVVRVPCSGFGALSLLFCRHATNRPDYRIMAKPYQRPELRRVGTRGTGSSRLDALLDGSERRRSTRVLIQIPVQALFRTASGIEQRMDIFTLAVNAHGCLLAMETKPKDGQKMSLFNAKSAAEQTGRVVRSKRAPEGYFAVAFEFDSPSPHLWSILTPPEDWLVSRILIANL